MLECGKSPLGTRKNFYNMSMLTILEQGSGKSLEIFKPQMDKVLEQPDLTGPTSSRKLEQTTYKVSSILNYPVITF